VFLADDIVLFPVKSLLSLFREIYNAAVQEIADEADSIRTELGELYQRLETGELDEEAFDARERELLDRLDEIEASGSDDDDDSETDEDQEEEEEDDLDEEVEEDDLDEEDEDDLDEEQDEDDES
jgi:ribonuclease E